MTYIRWILTLIALLLSLIAYRTLFPGPIPPPVPAPDPVEGMLDCRLPQFKVENMRVDDAVALLAKQTHIPIHVDWADVEVHVKFKDRRISLDLHDVPIWAVLKTIFGADWTNQGVHFNVEGGEVLVGLGGFFKAEEMHVRVYDLRDLLTDEYWGETTPPEKRDVVRNERTTAVIFMIQSEAALFNHQFPGGSRADDGSLDGFAWEREMAGQFIVAQTSYGQRQIEMAIAGLRAKKPFERVELAN